MGLFTRLKDIVAGNLNALLDKVDNPERMLAQLIREMEASLAEARGQGAGVIACERRLLREREQHGDAARAWKERARLALDNRREDLARRALARHLEHAEAVRSLEQQYAAACKDSEEIQEALRLLEERLAEARRHQRLLKVRRQSAQVRGEWLAVNGAGMNGRSPFARYALLETKLTELEDDLLAHAMLLTPSHNPDAELAQLETDCRMARALEDLKEERRLGVEFVEGVAENKPGGNAS